MSVRLLLLGGLLVLSFLWVPLAQAQTTDAAKIEQLQKRFREGVRLENEGQLKEAREVFEKIIAEEPKAEGSLFYAAFTSYRLGDFDKAIDYIERFRQLAPRNFQGLVVAIQANQAKKRSVKVESLRKELWALRASGNIPGLSDSPSYVREKVNLGDGKTLVLSEFFDYQKEPYFLYEAKVFDEQDQVQRHLVITHDAEQTAILRARDAKYQVIELFYLSEFVIKDGEARQINVYRRELERPAYSIARDWIVDAVRKPPAVLESAPLQ